MWNHASELVRPYAPASAGLSCGAYRIYLDLEVRRVHCRKCRAVKRERLELLLENSLHTQRFARYVGRRCRSGTIKDVAAELHLDWHTVKRLEKLYMREPWEPSFPAAASSTRRPTVAELCRHTLRARRATAKAGSGDDPPL